MQNNMRNCQGQGLFPRLLLVAGITFAGVAQAQTTPSNTSTTASTSPVTGFRTSLTGLGKPQYDAVRKQNVFNVVLSSLTKRKPNYQNWSAHIKSLKTPSGVEVISLASSSADGSNASCPVNQQKDCRQEHNLLLNATKCSLAGDYVADFDIAVMDPVTNAILTQRTSVPFRLTTGGECAPGEVRKSSSVNATTIATSGSPNTPAADARAQPSRIVQLRFATAIQDYCLKQAGGEGSRVSFGYCNTLATQWRYQDNRLWTTTNSGDLCLVREEDLKGERYFLHKDCTNKYQKNVIQRTGTWAIKETQGQPARLGLADGIWASCVRATMVDTLNIQAANCDQQGTQGPLLSVETLPALPKYVAVQLPATILHQESTTISQCVLAAVARNADLTNPTRLTISTIPGTHCMPGMDVPTKYFEKEDKGNGLFRLKYAASNLCMAAASASAGSEVALQPCTDEARQKWKQDGKRLMLGIPFSADTISTIGVIHGSAEHTDLCLQGNLLNLEVAKCQDNLGAQHFTIVQDQGGGLVQKVPATLPAGKQLATQSSASTGKWTRLPGEAFDVAASANGLWVIGTNLVPGGGGLHRWDGKTFVSMSGGAARIDLDPQGNPWVVNNAGRVIRWTGSAWAGLPGDNAKDIGIGANGTAWMVGGAKVPGGFSVFRWNAGTNKWDAMSGGGVRIDVDPQGNAWLVNDANQIFRWTGSNWAGVPGKARDIGIGSEGSVFVVGDNGTVHKWDGKTWIMRDGILNEISVGPGGVPVGVNASKQIWMGYP